MDSSHIYNWVASLLYNHGVAPLEVRPLTTAILVGATLLMAWLLYTVTNRILDPLIAKIVNKTRIRWDDILLADTVRRQLWRWVVAFMLCMCLPLALKSYPATMLWSRLVVKVLLIICSAVVISAFINAAFNIMAERTASERAGDDTDDYRPATLEASTQSHSLGGVRQMLQLIVVMVTAILIFSVLSGKDIVIILSGLGASAAVLMLVFRDSILGLVAGIQLTVNDMLRPGDWISMPKYDVNGRVRKINLTTVKVQNYDNTIVTIPPYQLVSETFQNWRGMERSGGRRVMRSISIDMSTIRFCTPEEMAAWSDEPWGNRIHSASAGKPVNVSAFRAYLEHYITTLPTIVPDMLFMIREHQPTATGLPVELYFFTTATAWAEFEAVQAAVLDHVIAMVPHFGLRIFQSPSGNDIRHLNC